MKEQLKEALLSARESGSAKIQVSHNDSVINIRITSVAEAITVEMRAPEEHHCGDVVLEILGLLGHPPDAVYNIRQEETKAKTLGAVWAHPEKDFEDELRSVVPKILAPEHLILMVSDRLYRYLVPNHPDDWNGAQIQAWQDFWNLRLRDATFREWILQYTDPKVWDYFQVIGKSVNQDIIGKHTALGSMSPALQDRMETLFVSAAVTGFHLCYLHRRRHNLSLVSTVGNVDPGQMTERVLAQLSWENVPEGFAEVVNEINITDIRESGELFAQAVTMPPEVLNTMLSQMNKCGVLGFITGESVQGTTNLN